ncbi:MAG: DUF1587 domain-containing protein, partial [Planctomycetota bacterium]
MRDRPSWIGVLTALLFALPLATLDADEIETLRTEYSTKVAPLLESHCFRCHSEDRTEGDIDLGGFESLRDVRKTPKTWVQVDHMIDSRQMPPPKSKKLADSDRETIARWVKRYLTFEARSNAGDPGRVVLRRLNNAEYTYTVRDLTGVDSLSPTEQFPIDGAAGEGFTNTGDALVMSPALISKYLDAAKSIAKHAVLHPTGIRFSPHTTERDWTDENLAKIRRLYSRFTARGSGQAVNLQGIKFDTNQGGLLPLEAYLKASLELRAGGIPVEQLATKRGLSARYLERLRATLSSPQPKSFLLEQVRARWESTTPDRASELSEFIRAWQKRLFAFRVIGHIGRKGGPTRWQESVTVTSSSQSLEFDIPKRHGSASDVHLIVGDAGDGNESDFVIWKNPQIQISGRAAVPLRFAQPLANRLERKRRQHLQRTTEYLSAVLAAADKKDLQAIARSRSLSLDLLKKWFSFLALGPDGPAKISGHFTETLTKASNYDFVKGWGTRATPSIVANSKGQSVRIPGIARPRGVVSHPSPTLFAGSAWQSPIDGAVVVQSRVADAHPE